MEQNSRRPKGWYPDAEGGGTSYWNGFEWSGHRRPPRRPFAAAASHPFWGSLLVLVGALYVPVGITILFDPSEAVAVRIVSFAIAALLAGGLLAWGVYLLRGKGPTTSTVVSEVEEQWARERARAPIPGTSKAPDSPPARAAPQADSVINIHLEPGTAESARAEQIRVLADPATARSLQNLQNLLYTRTITEDEYQAAKDRLLADLN